MCGLCFDGISLLVSFACTCARVRTLLIVLVIVVVSVVVMLVIVVVGGGVGASAGAGASVGVGIHNRTCVDESLRVSNCFVRNETKNTLETPTVQLVVLQKDSPC
jgi:hypothetical protein